ncbi:MAG: pyrroloquinoline quinone biosynthesis protein PqqB [Gammaproteobacteria bacterium]|nr:pyrroloquinoline quinone biosynthesis protein PqqB [Gammaproteobacteria bacterium]
MRIRVLGSAAGGGFPQWNCNCRNCAGVRAGTLRAQRRTQSSIVVAGTSAHEAVLVNASPDILAQLQAAPQLQPARAARDTAIRSIVLVDGQVDHTAGLLMLREATRPWPLWCTEAVRLDLTEANPLFAVLEHYCGLEHHTIDPVGTPFSVAGAPGVVWRAVALHSKPAPFSSHRNEPVHGDNIGLLLEDESTGRRLFYAPGLGAMSEEAWECMQGADCVLVDGTFWSEDEMVRLGLSQKYACDMGHLPQSGADGMIEWLDRLPKATRKILIHINNTNPILDEDSPERRELDEHGIEVAYDGMEVLL